MTAELWPQHGVSSESWLCVQALQAVLMLCLTISAPDKPWEKCSCQAACLGKERKREGTYFLPVLESHLSALLLTKGGFASPPSPVLWAAEVAVSAKMYAGQCQEFSRFQSRVQLLGRIQI